MLNAPAYYYDDITAAEAAMAAQAAEQGVNSAILGPWWGGGPFFGPGWGGPWGGGPWWGGGPFWGPGPWFGPGWRRRFW
ncbi:MAG: hypothetical protein VB144_02760 [Clostridia bacterium]|nr:hypothetical protein [Clostridia bacterium]